MGAGFQLALTSIASVIASSGFWAYILRKDDRRNATTRLLMGLAYDQLTTRGVGYIEQGWVTREEYGDFKKYYYDPYKALGGNGVADRIMEEVSGLPLMSHSRYAEIFRNREEGWVNNVRVISRDSQEAPTE